jgi:hypothetical protein
MNIDTYLDKMLAKQAKEDALVTFTQEEIENQAVFLLGWAKGKKISKFGATGNFYKCGKFMTSMKPQMIAGLLKAEFVVGNTQGFKVNKVTVQEKTCS